MPFPDDVKETLNNELLPAMMMKLRSQLVAKRRANISRPELRLREVLNSRFLQELHADEAAYERMRRVGVAEEAIAAARKEKMQKLATGLLSAAAGPLAGTAEAVLTISIEAAKAAATAAAAGINVSVEAIQSAIDAASEVASGSKEAEEEYAEKAEEEGMQAASELIESKGENFESSVVDRIWNKFDGERLKALNHLLGLPLDAGPEVMPEEGAESKLLQGIVASAIAQCEKEGLTDTAAITVRMEAYVYNYINDLDMSRDIKIQQYLEKVGNRLTLSDVDKAMINVAVMGRFCCKDDVPVIGYGEGVAVNSALFEDVKVGTTEIMGAAITRALTEVGAKEVAPSPLFSFLTEKFPEECGKGKRRKALASTVFNLHTDYKRRNMLVALRVMTQEVQSVAGHHRMSQLTDEEKEQVLARLLQVAFATPQFCEHKANPMLHLLLHFEPLVKMTREMEPAVLSRIVARQQSMPRYHVGDEAHKVESPLTVAGHGGGGGGASRPKLDVASAKPKKGPVVVESPVRLARERREEQAAKAEEEKTAAAHAPPPEVARKLAAHGLVSALERSRKAQKHTADKSTGWGRVTSMFKGGKRP